jgi:hypothetical protein
MYHAAEHVLLPSVPSAYEELLGPAVPNLPIRNTFFTLETPQLKVARSQSDPQLSRSSDCITTDFSRIAGPTPPRPPSPAYDSEVFVHPMHYTSTLQIPQQEFQLPATDAAARCSEAARTAKPHTNVQEGCNDTTMIIRNIPSRIEKSSVVKAIDLAGFTGLYEGVVLPKATSRRGKSKGYAFVRFKSPQVATEFQKTFQDYQFPDSQSTKRCMVMLATSEQN